MTAIKMPPRSGVSIPFLDQIERQSLEEEVVHALTYAIPRLYQLEFDDASSADLPASLFGLVTQLESDLMLDFPEGTN